MLYSFFFKAADYRMINPYIAVLITILVSIGIAVLMIGVTSLLGPKITSKSKGEPFEAGSVPLTPVKRRMHAKFYLIAALFVMFDVEVLFMYPWAVEFRNLGMFGFVAMSIFLLILTLGLVYEWKKGALEWT